MSIYPKIDYDSLTNAELDWVQDSAAGNIELNEVAAPSGTASGVGILYVKSSDSNLYYQDDSGAETNLSAGAGGAPTNAQYVVLALNGTLTAERVLTQTDRQVFITDAGANGNVTLSTPQDIHPTAQLRMGSAIINGSQLILGGTATISVFGATLTDDASAAAARTTLGVVIGTDVQAYDNDLADLAALTHSASAMIASDGTDWTALSAAQTRASLGLRIGTDVQAYDNDLADLAALAHSASAMISSDGTDWLALSAAQTRASLGLIIGTDVQAYNVNLLNIAAQGTAKAAILVATGTAWGELLVGSNDQVLTADSTTDTGLKWAAAGGGGGGGGASTSEVVRWIDAADFSLPETSFAARSKYGTVWVHTVLDFDQASDEYAFYKIQIPRYIKASMTSVVELFWTVSTAYVQASSSAVRWQILTRPITSGEAFDSLASPAVTTAAVVSQVNANNNLAIGTALIGQTGTAWTVADLLEIQVRRDADNGDDNLAGDARLFGVNINIQG